MRAYHAGVVRLGCILSIEVPSSTPVGPVHLHQAYYRYPSYNPDGSPYGGAGLKVVRHRYFRGDGGTYTFGWEVEPRIKAKGSRISY